MIRDYPCKLTVDVGSPFLTTQHDSILFPLMDGIITLSRRQFSTKVGNGLQPGTLILLQNTANSYIAGVHFDYKI
jgi:hypothetical protein